MALEPASKKALRLAHNRAASDAVVAETGAAPSTAPRRRLLRESLVLPCRLQTQKGCFLLAREKYSLLY